MSYRMGLRNALSSHRAPAVVTSFLLLLFWVLAVPQTVVAFSLQLTPSLLQPRWSIDRVNPFTLYQATRRTKTTAPYVVSTSEKIHPSKSSQRSIWSLSNPTQLKNNSQQQMLRRIVRYRRKRNLWTSSVRNASESLVSATSSTIGKLSSSLSLSLPSTAVDVSVVLATAQILRQSTERTLEQIQDAAVTSVLNFWYLVPSVLCFVPLYTLAVWQAPPVTPAVWKLVNMDFVWRTGTAISVVTAFLASNASYLLAGAFLLHKSGALPMNPSLRKKTTMPSSLGWWVLTAGGMSTLFHTVQAVGDYRIAEAMCYLDHGVAGTAVLYYWYQCGRPSVRAMLCGGAGLVSLAFPAAELCPPAYTWLHSLWHALSALAAVWWACDAPGHSAQSTESSL